HFAQWIANGRHGAMAYLARDNPPDRADARGQYLREDLRNAFPWAQSVLCCALGYHAPGPRSTDGRPPGHGWIARYAWGDDYHQILLAKLRAVAARLAPALAAADRGTARLYVDTGPLVERVVGYHAGLGWIGKNTCLIHPRRGSFFFLGVIVLAAEVEPDSPLPDHCGSCRRCIDACPTEALTPYQMDAQRCIAYLNLELRGPIPLELRAAMGDNIIGCDICQDVCPWNEKAARGPVAPAPEFAPRLGRVAPELATLATMSEEDYRHQFRGSAAKRAKYVGLLRNIAVALGNNPGPDAGTILAQMAQHADPMVREHAAWALGRIPQGDREHPATAPANSYAAD
ncbi:MAG: tRNA epoxyqueuosine(34) reductase QueG, partial [Terriglobales bacterium]